MEVLAAHGGARGIRDEALLESAVAAPQASMNAATAHLRPSRNRRRLPLLSCRNHAFIDGNKRTALAGCLVFLESNNLLPGTKLFTDEWEAFVLDVAASRLDRDETTARLRKLLKRQRKPGQT